MKRILLLVAVAIVFFSCGESTSKKRQVVTEIKKTDVVEVLYFYGKQRCISCNAIEQLTKEVVDSLNNNKIVMTSIDISLPENEGIADKYEVSWSSLFLDRGGKIENLTDTGFSYAKGKPQVFKAKLVEAIEKMSK